MSAHPTMRTPFPPDERTFEGSLMLHLAAGTLDPESEWFERRDIIEADEFGEYWDGEPLTLDQARERIREVVAAYREAVPEVTPDERRLTQALDALEAKGVAHSWAGGFDTHEGAEDGHQHALNLAQQRGEDSLGYVYITMQDLLRHVFNGRLFIGFSEMSGELGDEALEVARLCCEEARAAGFTVEWDGTTAQRITLVDVALGEPIGEDALDGVLDD